MSKADEFKEAIKTRPVFVAPGWTPEDPYAIASDEGRLLVRASQHGLPPAAALAFARWILETFE